MEFAERYIRALARSDNRQDAALMAAALAAAGTEGGLGALLCRARTVCPLDGALCDGLAGAEASRLLAQLLHLWTAEVARQGRARRWVADARPWDAHAAQRLYRAVAEHSLAHWLAPHCDVCGGSGRQAGGRGNADAGCTDRADRADCAACAMCAGTGTAPLACRGGFMRERVRDMVSELHRIADRHARLAARRLAHGAAGRSARG